MEHDDDLDDIPPLPHATRHITRRHTRRCYPSHTFFTKSTPRTDVRRIYEQRRVKHAKRKYTNDTSTPVISDDSLLNQDVQHVHKRVRLLIESRMDEVERVFMDDDGSPSVIVHNGNVELIDKTIQPTMYLSSKHSTHSIRDVRSDDSELKDLSGLSDPFSPGKYTRPATRVTRVAQHIGASRFNKVTPSTTPSTSSSISNGIGSSSSSIPGTVERIVNNVPIMIVCDSIVVDDNQSGTVFRIESTSVHSVINITLPDPLIRPGMQFTFILTKPRKGQCISIDSDGSNAYPFEWSTMISKNPTTLSLQPKIVNVFNSKDPDTFHTTPLTLMSGRDILNRGIWFSNNLTFGWLPVNDYVRPYEEIKGDIQELDMIVFRGNEFISNVITTMERLVSGKGDWSHVGIVISKKLLPDLNTYDPPDTLYIWESTLSHDSVDADEVQKMPPEDTPRPSVCAESNQPVFGVQIRRLNDVLRHCFKKKVKVGWCKLIVNPQRKRLDETEDVYMIRLNNMKKMLQVLHRDYYHRPYEKNVFRLFSSLSPRFSCCRSDCCPGRTWVFCSQLVSIIYQQLGLINEDIDPALITPQMLVSPETSKIPSINLTRIVATPIILTSQ